MKTILILMDSLNRHALRTYNEHSWVETPNIDRLAKKSVIFDNHWLGSAPCMPARRDLMTGRLNFLEKGWGAIEPFDITLPEKLRENNIFTHMVTDHYHYLEIGGENYCQIFNTWDMHRGQESDPWVSRVDSINIDFEYYGQVRPQYELNRTRFKNESDYPTPRTVNAACKWLDENKDADDFFLWIELFDPHEPFDCPDEYLEIYNDNYQGPRYNWPKYAPVKEPDDATEHIQKRYAATLTMADRWLGKLFDVMDKHNLWEDTLLIFTGDHGHMLGEHNFLAKNYMHVYNELAHLPLFIHLPKSKNAGKRIGILTQNIDIMPTILDYYCIDITQEVRGFSLKPALEGNTNKLRDVILYGYHGMAVNVTDGEYTYFRVPSSYDNYPCYIYTAIPTTLRRYLGTSIENQIEAGRFLKYTNYPVFKIPVSYKDERANHLNYIRNNFLFDIVNDYKQQNPINDSSLEDEMIQKLILAMRYADSPDEQFERLNLKSYD